MFKHEMFWAGAFAGATFALIAVTVMVEMVFP